MTEERKQLIDKFQKWLDTNPAPLLIASECANIAEEYSKCKAIRYKAELLDKTEEMIEVARKLFGEDFKGANIALTNFRFHLKQLYKKHFNQ